MIFRLDRLKSRLESRVVNAWYKRLLKSDLSHTVHGKSLNEPDNFSETFGRPRLLLLSDVRGWAFDELCRQRAEYLSGEWDCEIRYIVEDPDIDPSRYDLMFNQNQGYSKYDRMFHGRYVRGFFSLKWARTDAPAKSIYVSTRGAVACVGPSREIVEGLRPYCPNTYLVKEGIDPRIYYWIKNRTENNLVVGWSGNPDSSVKRLQSVVIPACKAAGVELRIATSLTPEALNLFYNDVDVVVMASVPMFEGNPLSIYEAGACGRTVIATNTGTVPETIENDKTGFVVEATDDNEITARDIAERLIWCRSHLSETRLMGGRLREKILVERIPEITCKTFKKVMEIALAHSISACGCIRVPLP